MGSLTPHKVIMNKVCETGPTIYRTYPRRLDSLTIYRSSSETQGQIVGPKTKIKTGEKKFNEQKYERLGRKLFCPIRSEYSFGRLELVRKEFVPRALYFSFVLLLVEFFPARFDFRLRPTICPWVSEDVCRYHYKGSTFSSAI